VAGRQVTGTVGLHHFVDAFVVVVGKAEVTVDRLDGRGGAAAYLFEMFGRYCAQSPVDAPITLQHQVVVHVVGVEVRQRERVVVAGNRPETGEDEVRAREEHRQSVSAAADVGFRDEIVVACTGFEVAQHHHQVLGE
jgi:hypothetical protein